MTNYFSDYKTICTYIPPINSVHSENDMFLLDNEKSFFSSLGKILLMWDFNARTGKLPDFIVNDQAQINKFSAQNLLPENYKADTEVDRINQDTVINSQGKSLLELCISARLAY